MVTVGIDFGTSNTVVSFRNKEEVGLIPLQKGKSVLPSTLFFGEHHTFFVGQEAIDVYLEGREGRFLRSLKSVLGTSLIEEKTLIFNQQQSLQDVLILYFKYLKQQIDNYLQIDDYNLILGRPVFFVDDNKEADKKAEQQILEIAQCAEFKGKISFKYEPVAATAEYRQKDRSSTCLIIDIGGGTSDFSITNLKSGEILSNYGVHIGGNDFDKSLSLNYFMSTLGYGSKLKKEGHYPPKSLYHALASWHRIHSLYNEKTTRQVRELLLDSLEPQKIQRLKDILDHFLGHNLALDVEKVKIHLGSEETSCSYSFSELTTIPTERLRLESRDLTQSSQDLVDKIKEGIFKTLEIGTLKSADIDTLIFTGGTASMSYIQNEIKGFFSKEIILVHSHPFSAVALGLVLD
ncbi:MAG: Hsp70 family protein [Alphaproteobacteria bacterium]|nr:Hsp70 family protein [Alphaproteobacteria bacterium]